MILRKRIILYSVKKTMEGHRVVLRRNLNFIEKIYLSKETIEIFKDPVIYKCHNGFWYYEDKFKNIGTVGSRLARRLNKIIDS